MLGEKIEVLFPQELRPYCRSTLRLYDSYFTPHIIVVGQAAALNSSQSSSSDKHWNGIDYAMSMSLSVTIDIIFNCA